MTSLPIRTCWLLFVLVCRMPCEAAESPAKITFEEHIRPILRAHCLDCHGATEDIKGELDLRQVRLMLKGGSSGAAISVGKPADSYLMDRVRSGEMPPGSVKLKAEEIERLERWIEAGAQTARPEPEKIGPGLGITPEERDYWAFRPLKVPTVTAYPAEARVRTPIDALLLKAMPEGWGFAPDADRATLIKRLYFDLIGLPPSPEEMQKWLSDGGQDWYERLMNELLESPHYGERWARHWLDIAGYADSEGYTVNDAERPWAWKYRDYVIRSLNANKPFDRFIHEQLAGDELAGPRSGDLTPDQTELLAATGFLRTVADGTGSGADNPESRNQVVADTLRVVTTTMLGLSVACAQCHDHRYDPIPQTDYYALRAVFEPALDWKNWKNPPQRLVSLASVAERQQAAEIEKEAQKQAQERQAMQDKFISDELEKQLLRADEQHRVALREGYRTEAAKRTKEQNELLQKHPFVKDLSPGALYLYNAAAAEELKKKDAAIAAVRATKPKEEFLHALVEPENHTPPTQLFHRGDHRQPKQTVAPAALSVLSADGGQRDFSARDAALKTTGRRLAFAKWLTSDEQPLTARVLVNRIWMHHFGRGLVDTPADFGKLGTVPTHPELLDWLAHEFRSGRVDEAGNVQEAWSLKRLHRLILTSTAWRQSSSRDPQRDALDPANRFYARKSLMRLEAETLRDRMLAASGVLDRTQFGPALTIKEDETGQVIVDGEQRRRSLYIKQRRSQPVGMLQAFDAPVMETNCERRPVSTVATQSLILLNGEFTLAQATKLATRAQQELRELPADANPGELPKLRQARAELWQFGFGSFDEATQRTGSFTPLGHWTGSTWQGDAQLPNAKSDWALLHAQGGHPGAGEKLATVRRWIAPAGGVLTISGKLSHGSPNGDGVRGRIVSSRNGLAGTWMAQNNGADTPVANLMIEGGDTIDFITDARENVNSDSFTWSVELALHRDSKLVAKWDSIGGFHGPVLSSDDLPRAVASAWELAYCRPIRREELVPVLNFLDQQLELLNAHPERLPQGVRGPQQALTNLCQALLGSNEFLYVE